MATRHYTYRCTTDKLADALDQIEDAGDTVLERKHMGGRDWVIICRAAELLVDHRGPLGHVPGEFSRSAD